SLGDVVAQAFRDGNKRTAFAASDVFLRLNGLVFRGDPVTLAGKLEAVATRAGDLGAATAEFEMWLRTRSRSRDEMTKRLKYRRYIILILLVMGTLVICVLSVFLHYYLYTQGVNEFIKEASFCTTEDEVYQVLEARHEEWMQYFSSLPEGPRTFSFSTPSGDRYMVLELYSSQSLLVPTGWKWLDPWGSRGYIYSSTGYLGEYFSDADSEYEVTHLHEQVYCYRIKPGAEP